MAWVRFVYIILLFIISTLSIATGTLHLDLLLTRDDHVESRLCPWSCFKTKRELSVWDLRLSDRVVKWVDVGPSVVKFSSPQSQLLWEEEAASGKQMDSRVLVVMLRRNIRQESEGNERKLESVEINDTFNHSHHSRVFEMNKLTVFKWSPTQSVHHSNKAPEGSRLPNDRFIQNSSYSVWDLNTFQQCRTNRPTVPLDKTRSHLQRGVRAHRIQHWSKRGGSGGPACPTGGLFWNHRIHLSQSTQ